RCGISGKVARLSVARQFLFHLSAVVPDLEVPSATLLARPRRRKPFLFSAEEISRLLKAALSLRPQGSLRPHTLSTLLGLLANSEIRGEALTAPDQSGSDVATMRYCSPCIIQWWSPQSEMT